MKLGILLLTLLSGSPDDINLVQPVVLPEVQRTAAAGPPTFLVGQSDGFQVPETAIVGADKPIRFGKVVNLRVKPIGAKPTGLYSVSYVWRMHPTADDVVVLADGSQVIFGSGTEPMTVNVELIACYLFLAKDQNGTPQAAQRVVVVDRDIVIAGSPPVPGPGPAPPPAPGPTVPDTPLGLAKLATKWGEQVQQPDLERKRKEASALARSLRGITSIVAAGVEYNSPDGTSYKLDDPGKLLKATLVSNNAAIPQSVEQWRPWFVSLQAALTALKSSGKLETIPDYTAAWDELATGLEAIAR